MNKTTKVLLYSGVGLGAFAGAMFGSAMAHADPVSDTASTTCIVLSGSNGFSGNPAMDAASIVGVAQALGEHEGVSTAQAVVIEHMQVMRYCPSLLPYWNNAERWAESVADAPSGQLTSDDQIVDGHSHPVRLATNHGGGHGGNHGHGGHHTH